MKTTGIVISLLLLFSIAFASDGDDEAKALSGISIVGNKEAPKALYIVPWKSSELGLSLIHISEPTRPY